MTPGRSAPLKRTPITWGGAQHERLAEHHGLGLDPADAEAEHAEPVDHRRVRVGPDERVGNREAAVLAQLDDASEVLEVDLVHDPHAGRHDAEAVERALRPAQQLVALAVALVLAVDVARIREIRPERVDLHRVVDHEVARHQRVDTRRVAARARHRGAHRSEVDDGRDAREVLEHDARRLERHRRAGGSVLRVAGERLDVALGLTCSPPLWRSRFSSRILTVWGSRETSAMPSSDEALEANVVGSAAGKRGSRVVGIVGHPRTIAIVRVRGRRPAPRAPDERARTHRPRPRGGLGARRADRGGAALVPLALRDVA